MLPLDTCFNESQPNFQFTESFYEINLTHVSLMDTYSEKEELGDLIAWEECNGPDSEKVRYHN